MGKGGLCIFHEKDALFTSHLISDSIVYHISDFGLVSRLTIVLVMVMSKFLL